MKISAKKPLSPAAFYTLLIAFATFVGEALIMGLFAFFHVQSHLLQLAIDSVLLTMVLIPSFYFFIYTPMKKENDLRSEAHRKAEEYNRQLKESAENLQKTVDIKVNELRSTDARYASILENSNDIIIGSDADKKIVFWNRMAQETFGYSREEIIGKEIAVLVPDLYRKKFIRALDCFMGAGDPSCKKLHENKGHKKNGIAFPMEFSLSHYESEGKTLITAVMRDITERKQAELKIKRQVKKLTALRTIDLAISSTLELKLSLDTIIDQVLSTMNADAADILLFNRKALRLEYAASKGFRTKALAHTSLKLGEGFAGKAAYENRAIFIKDLQKEAGSLNNAPCLPKEGFVSYACIPLVAKGNLKGALEVFRREQYDYNEEEHIEFLESLGLQAAIAIDNASMYNDLYRSNLELSLAYDRTIEGWSRALDLRDKETEGHSQRVTELTVRIAKAMGVDEADLEHMRWGALLHDIGKMGIPDSILLKNGSLNPEEWEIMRKHPSYAYELLSPIKHLSKAIDIPYCHHEKWDGTGYPRGLKGEEIPLSARIFSVVDVWDALTSDRPYRSKWPEEKVREHIKSLSGKHFDPMVVEVFLGDRRQECIIENSISSSGEELPCTNSILLSERGSLARKGRRN